MQHLYTYKLVITYPFALDGFAIYGSLEPDGSPMEPLDEHHGHVGSDGVYHYHGTETYPYLIAAMRGEVTTEGSAPEDQISPQPSAEVLRQISPISSANDSLLITNMTANGSNGYTLEYSLNNQTGSVTYSWNLDKTIYTFIYTSPSGKIDTLIYNR
ncbi:MAG: hypothetical protein GY810_29650 [Aureispira sp.]|nr:hypothetical protein [Aureispira sp.]